MTTTLALSRHDEGSYPTTSTPTLTTREAAALVTLALAHFALLHGPIWRHPWSPDASIVWSYVPIPILVALVLLRGRRLGITSWFLGTLQVATFKFVISASFLIALWAITNPPPVVPSTMRPAVTAAPAQTFAPSTLPPVDLSLGDGVEQHVRLPAGAPLRVRSGDGRMHTLQLPALGLNVPIVAGAERTLSLTERGTFTLGCAVHPDEPRVTLVVE